jgi:hypothetical protein
MGALAAALLAVLCLAACEARLSADVYGDGVTRLRASVQRGAPHTQSQVFAFGDMLLHRAVHARQKPSNHTESEKLSEGVERVRIFASRIKPRRRNLMAHLTALVPDADTGMTKYAVDLDQNSLIAKVRVEDVLVLQIDASSPGEYRVSCFLCHHIVTPAGAVHGGLIVPRMDNVGAAQSQADSGDVELNVDDSHAPPIFYFIGNHYSVGVALLTTHYKCRAKIERLPGNEHRWMLTLTAGAALASLPPLDALILPGPHPSDIYRQWVSTTEPTAVMRDVDVDVRLTDSTVPLAAFDGFDAAAEVEQLADLGDVTGIRVHPSANVLHVDPRRRHHQSHTGVVEVRRPAQRSVEDAIRAAWKDNAAAGETLSTSSVTSAKGTVESQPSDWHSGVLVAAQTVGQLHDATWRPFAVSGPLIGLHALAGDVRLLAPAGATQGWREREAALAAFRADAVERTKVLASVARYHADRAERLLADLINSTLENLAAQTSPSSSGAAFQTGGERCDGPSFSREMARQRCFEAASQLWWAGLRSAPSSLLGLSIAGGALAGHGYTATAPPPCDEELLTRVVQLATLSPAAQVPSMCNWYRDSPTPTPVSLLSYLLHAHNERPARADGAVEAEQPSALLAVRFALRERQRFAPFLQTASAVASIQAAPLLTPLVFEWSTNMFWAPRDYTFLIGQALAVRPIVEQKPIRALMAKPTDGGLERWYDANTFAELPSDMAELMMPATLADMPTLFRGGHIIPLARERRTTGAAQLTRSTWQLQICVGARDGADGYLYFDDGTGTDALRQLPAVPSALRRRQPHTHRDARYVARRLSTTQRPGAVGRRNVRGHEP